MRLGCKHVLVWVDRDDARSTDRTNLAGKLVAWSSGFMAREITDKNIMN